MSITYDGWALLEAGHALRTPTGRLYVIEHARQQKRGRRVGRWHLKCRVHDGEVPADAVVHPLHWYKRPRKKS